MRRHWGKDVTESGRIFFVLEPCSPMVNVGGAWMSDALIQRLCGPLLALGAAVLVFAAAWLMLGSGDHVFGRVLVYGAQLTGAVGLVLCMVLLWTASRHARI
jgi:hypothetical protein